MCAMTTRSRLCLFGFAWLLSIGACQAERKPTPVADAALPIGTGGTVGAPETGAEQAPLDSSEDSALDSAVSAGVTLSPPSADFGAVVQGASSAPPTIFTVTNAGLPTALKPTLIGPFAMVSNTCDILATGRECTIGLSFNPVVLGTSSGVLIVAAGATAILTGTGVTPAAPAFTPTTQAISAPIGGVSSPISFALDNYGGSATGALTLTLGGDVDQFIIDNQCIGPLAELSSCRINVVFKPTRVGVKVLTLTIIDASSPATSAVATVTGTALIGDGPSLYGSGDFGTVAIGATSPAHDFTIANPGSSDSGILTISVTDTQFVVTSDGCSNLPLAAGKSCTFSMVFKPSAVGPFGANVVFSGPGVPTSSLPIKGVGAMAGGDGGTYVDGGGPSSDGKVATEGGTGGSNVDGGGPS